VYLKTYTYGHRYWLGSTNNLQYSREIFVGLFAPLQSVRGRECLVAMAKILLKFVCFVCLFFPLVSFVRWFGRFGFRFRYNFRFVCLDPCCTVDDNCHFKK